MLKPSKILPDKPGVYLMKESSGRVIYVGKAASLKDRVKSYFQKGASLKALVIASRTREIDYILTSSELEALILESNLIKKLKPRYNIILRDDKQYPYLKLTLNEEYPRLLMVRRIEPDQARYFGPFQGGMVRETIRLVKRLYPIRWCKETPMKKRARPCLQFYLKRCVGPCIEVVNKEAYRKLCQELSLFLEARFDEALERLREEMRIASERLDFERAAGLRDRIELLEKMAEGQKVLSTDLRDRDVAAMAVSGSRAMLTIFQIREGKLIGKENYYLEGIKGESPAEITGTTLSQYYRDAAYIPPEIILDRQCENQALLEKWLKHPKILVPKGGERKALVEMAAENARAQLEEKLLAEAKEGALLKLKEELNLSVLPYRIEGFDVSNILETDIVGSMVAFEGGLPLKSDYRRFLIKTVEAQSDVAAIFEIVKRRYSGSLAKELPLPDLVLIDGGIGQVKAAQRGLRAAGKLKVPVVALAKKEEEVYSPDRKSPVRLAQRSKALHLLQHIRDEAHRFALAYHRLKRGKRLFH